MISGFVENPLLSPVTPGKQDQLQSSLLSAELIYQFTQIGGVALAIQVLTITQVNG